MKSKRLAFSLLSAILTVSTITFANPIVSNVKAYPIGGVDYKTISRVYNTHAHVGSQNNAIILSDTIPDVAEPGQTYPVSVTVKNTGTTTWDTASGYYLGYVKDSNPFYTGTIDFNTARVDLDSAVAPGATKTINFSITTPTTPGVYYANLQFLKQFDEWFGTALGKAVTVKALAAKTGNSAEILSDTIPDVVEAGKVYDVSVTAVNTGDTTWKASANNKDEFAYYLGAAQDNNPFDVQAVKNFKSARITLPADVAPGATTTVNFQIKAPATAGIYTSKWQVVHQFDQWFGGTLAKSVTVNASLD